MSKLLLTVLVLLWTSISLAEETQLPVLIISDGNYAWMIQGTDGKPVLYEFSQVIILGKPGTKPPVEIPPSEFNLETQAKQWLKTVPLEALPNRVEIAKALSDTASSALAKKFTTLREMETALGAALSFAIKDKPSWAAFGASLQASYNTLKSPNVEKIKTPEDFGRALLEIARGMQ